MTETDQNCSFIDKNINRDIWVLPGDCLLKHEADIVASTGTYLKNGNIFASICGKLEVETINENAKIDDRMDVDSEKENSLITKRIVRVVRPGSKKVPFLEPGLVVTARVLRTTNAYIKCSIHCVEDYILKQPYSGLIRADDIREYDRDKILVSKCFRPGDIILARVLAYGENHQFLLTTAAPELGLVIATNDWNEPMIPVSLNEVLCPRTYTKETRKVAKIDLI